MSSDPRDPFSDDLREFMFSAEPGLVSIETIELRHPAFVDGHGHAVAVRVANDPQDILATLEADAPMNGGQQVTFSAGRFELVPPDSPDEGLPTATISVANVTKILTPWLQQGVSTNAPVEVTFREYLSDDLTEPARVLDGLTLQDATASLLRVEVNLTFEDTLNAPFPDTIYRTDVFRGLVR